ncbi:MAG: endonuclease III [Cytophagales bacterium]|nr:endonuclease III [Cytophagales bacterium]
MKRRYSQVLQYFESNNSVAETELHYANPYELLVAVILSAQCTDKRVNTVTPALFERFPNAEALMHSHFDELFPYIKSISYPNNKTKNLLAMAKLLVHNYKGTVPDSVEDLMKLPGVGRKTANVIASVIYHLPAMAVDTHVFRVSRRIGLADDIHTTPLAVEKQLMEHIPQNMVHKAHHWLILHGRYICKARKPNCEKCGLTLCCKYFELNYTQNINPQ